MYAVGFSSVFRNAVCSLKYALACRLSGTCNNSIAMVVAKSAALEDIEMSGIYVDTNSDNFLENSAC
jgi:hypothetical protein